MPESFLKIIDIGLTGLLYTKFGDILEGIDSIAKGVIRCPREVALRERSEKMGEDVVEFINMWRTRTAPSWARQRTPLARRGMTLGYTSVAQTDIDEVKAMPVDLSYDIWFWTQYKDRLNLIAERYLFWQQYNPNLNLLYDDTYPIELDLHFGELVDESTVAEKYEKGIIYVMRIPIQIDGWAFVASTVKSIKTIYFVAYDKNSIVNYSEIIVEDSNFDVEKESVLKLFEKTIVA